MLSVDFSRSFVTFVTPGRGNNARIQVEAICDVAGGPRYVLAASCKAEDTYAQDDLFRQPNYDFCAIFSDEEYCIVRAGVPLTACWRDIGRNADRFAEVSTVLAEAVAARCESVQEIVEATLAGAPLVGDTVLHDDDGEELARLLYPIKTMNVNDPAHSPTGDWVFQVDTGPLIAPVPRWQVDLGVEALELAFIAWNAAEGAELITLAPTPLNHSDDCVGHYSSVRKIAARNEVLVLR